jgi:hypothetical protein
LLCWLGFFLFEAVVLLGGLFWWRGIVLISSLGAMFSSRH